MSINRVFVTGGLTKDPELQQAGASMLLKLRIVVSDRKKNAQTDQWEDVPNYFDVLVWGGRGESLSRFLHKGSKVAVAGRLRWSEWQTPEGNKRSKVEIVADDVDFMSMRNDQGAPAASSNASYEPPNQSAPSVEVLTEDIPF